MQQISMELISTSIGRPDLHPVLMEQISSGIDGTDFQRAIKNWVLHLFLGGAAFYRCDKTPIIGKDSSR
jgi:hypothetical protein